MALIARLLLAILLLAPSLAWAQSQSSGYQIAPDCTKIPSPVPNKLLCWNFTTKVWAYWNGTTYVTIAGPTGVVTSLSATAPIVVSAATGAVNISLANTAVTPASYGDATHVAAFTVDAKGRLTAASNVAISGAGLGSITVAAGSGTGLTIAGSPVSLGGTVTLGTTTDALRYGALGLGVAPGAAGTLKAAGAITATGQASINPSGGVAHIDLGTGGTTQAAYIDFHSDAANAGYGVRLLASASGAASGSGTMNLNGTLSIAPVAAAAQQGLVVTQSGPTSGTWSTSAFGAEYNSITVSSDAADVTGSTVGLRVGLTTGGANATGTKVALRGYLNKAATSGSGIVDHIALSGIATSSAGDGGTNTGAGAKGTLFSGEFLAYLQSGATNVFLVSGAEVQAGIFTGASARYRLGWSVVGAGNLQAADLDAAYEIAATTQGWKTGIILTNIHGAAPLSTTGTVIGSDGSAVTITNFASLPTYTITGNIFNFSNFSVTGAGALTGLTLATTSGAAAQYGGAASSGLYIDPTNLAFRLAAGAVSPRFFWQTATGAATYANLGAVGLRVGDSTAATVAGDFVGSVNASVGYMLNGAAPTGTFLRGNGTTFVTSALILPNASTSKAIPYASAANTWGEDATAFCWDGSNHRLGVGTCSPDEQFTIQGGSTALPSGTLTATEVLGHWGTDSGAGAWLVDVIGGGFNITGRRMGGSFASPSALAGNTNIVTFDARARDDAAFTGVIARIALASAANTLSTSEHNAKVVVSTTPAGSTTLTVAATFDSDQTLNVVGGYKANGTAGLSVTKTVRAAGGAADCTLIYSFGLLTGGSC